MRIYIQKSGRKRGAEGKKQKNKMRRQCGQREGGYELVREADVCQQVKRVCLNCGGYISRWQTDERARQTRGINDEIMPVHEKESQELSAGVGSR